MGCASHGRERKFLNAPGVWVAHGWLAPVLVTGAFVIEAVGAAVTGGVETVVGAAVAAVVPGVAAFAAVVADVVAGAWVAARTGDAAADEDVTVALATVGRGIGPVVVGGAPAATVGR